jgi:hypothetical protein
MNRLIKYFILPANLLLFAIALPQTIIAQQLTGTFIMSSVGGIENTYNNSMAISFTSIAACLNVQNGNAVLSGDRGTGNFSINCEVKTLFNSLGIKLYPNPVITTTKIKFINPPPLNDQFSISIWGADGFKITSGKATGFELFQGVPLDFSMLHAGIYIIQIESDKYRDAFKFIKAD